MSENNLDCEKPPGLPWLQTLSLLPLTVWWGMLVWLCVGKPITDLAYRWPPSLERLIEPAILIFGLSSLMGIFGSTVEGKATQKRVRFFLILTGFMAVDLCVWLSRISVSMVWITLVCALFIVVSLSALIVMRRASATATVPGITTPQ